MASDSLIAGSVAGALTRLCTCPLDVLKIRFQLQLEPIKKVKSPHFQSLTDVSEMLCLPILQSSHVSKYGGMVDAGRTILMEEGVTAFW